MSPCLPAPDGCHSSKRDIRKRLAYGTLSAACLFVALWFKPNSLIFLIGIELIWLVILFAHKRVLVITFIILGAVAYIAASAIPIFLMESRINVPLDNPTPKTAWIAMGLQESRDRAPGWYNNYVVNIYKEAPHDNNQVDALAKEAIANASRHSHRTPYMLRIFSLER